YAKQEKEVLTAVVEARAKATQTRIDVSQLTDPEKVKQFQDAQNQLSGALGRLLAVSENYPDLKSNQNFLALQSQLEGTENRITVARRDYIEAVRTYNTELRTFPGVLWASTAFRGNKPMAAFAAADDAHKPPHRRPGQHHSGRYARRNRAQARRAREQVRHPARGCDRLLARGSGDRALCQRAVSRLEARREAEEQWCVVSGCAERAARAHR